jgi:Phosphotransferase enzyme family
VQHRARGRRTVLEYRFESGARLFAKRYPRGEDAQASFDVLRRLEASGFGPGSPFRVAEPLGCFADWGVVVALAAPGVCIEPLVVGNSGAGGLRAAAGWLAHLHAVRVDAADPVEDLAHGVFRLARRAARAGASHPELAGTLVGLIEKLAERSADCLAQPALAHTHGRYHAGHVFLAAEVVTVIDLDRAALADPAKDVGEFLHRLRLVEGRTSRLGMTAPPRAARTFLEEYTASAGSAPGRLVYYWSYSVLAALLRLLEVGHERWEKRLAFLRDEFDAIPGRATSFAIAAGTEAGS